MGLEVQMTEHFGYEKPTVEGHDGGAHHHIIASGGADPFGSGTYEPFSQNRSISISASGNTSITLNRKSCCPFTTSWTS